MEESKNDKVWVTVDATFNLGNYENLKISTGISVTYTDEENPELIRKEITTELIREVLTRGKSVKNKLKPRRDV